MLKVSLRNLAVFVLQQITFRALEHADPAAARFIEPRGVFA